MANAYGYVRCSTGRQYEGDSPEAQAMVIRRTFEQTLMSKGVNLIEPFFEEQQSAYSREFLRRPAGMLINSKLQPGDHVLFAIHTRAFRRAEDWSATDALWRKKGVCYHYCNVPGFGHVDSGTAAGWMMYAAMAAGAQMESEQRSLTARTVSHYLRSHTQRAWCREHYCFDKRKNIKGEKIFVPKLERMADIYQWWWMRDVGFRDIQIHEVTEGNRRVREKVAPVVYHYDGAFREKKGMGATKKIADNFWAVMENPIYGSLLPKLEEIFRERWRHMPYGVPDFRGPKYGADLRHLLHPSILLHDGKNRGMPAFLSGRQPMAPAHDVWESAFQALKVGRPKSYQPSLAYRNDNGAKGGYLSR